MDQNIEVIENVYKKLKEEGNRMLSMLNKKGGDEHENICNDLGKFRRLEGNSI